jgi:hypothetical protein
MLSSNPAQRCTLDLKANADRLDRMPRLHFLTPLKALNAHAR